MTRALPRAPELLDPAPDLVRPLTMTIGEGLATDDAIRMVRVAQLLYTFWHTGDPDYLVECVDPTFVDNTLPAGRQQGPSGLLAASSTFRAAVPDLTCELADLLIAQDKLAVRLRFRGHFTGTFNGVRGAGQEVDFIAFDIQHVGTDRITEDWHLEDNLTFLTQIGQATVAHG